MGHSEPVSGAFATEKRPVEGLSPKITQMEFRDTKSSVYKEN